MTQSAPMRVVDLVPAALLAGTVAAVLAGAELLPLGTATVLVRVAAAAPADQLATALAAAAAGDAALVSVPAPGFAVLHGDAARIRAALGLTVVWNGAAQCAPKP